MTFFGLCLSSAALSGFGVWLLLKRFGSRLVDLPNERSSHTRPTPRSGGIAFVGAFLLATSIASLMVEGGERTQLQRTVMVLVPLWIVGIIDDVRGLPASLRYLVHLGVAVTAVTWFGPLPGVDAMLGSPWLSAFVAVIGVTALINFYNFMDGLDGLVAGTSTVQLAFFAFYLHQPVWWLLVAALIPFLLWNWPPAKVFMGDSGSTVLGGAVAVALLQAPDSIALWSATAVTVPVVGDAALTVIRRLLRRENIFEAHKTHVYQRLNQGGWSHGRVSGAYVGLTLIIAVAVLATYPV
ncbi:MAG: glycosyltransferase family 4 protein [Polyangiales bacterium]